MAKRKGPAVQAELSAAAVQQAAHAVRASELERLAEATKRSATQSLVEFDDLMRERWRVERYDLLAAEVGVTQSQLPLWHTMMLEAVEAGQLQRAWQIVRRLYGVVPVVPAVGSDPDDMRLWSREELCAQLRITDHQLSQEMDAVRAYWERAGSANAPEEEPEPSAAPSDTLLIEEEALARHGFQEAMFHVAGRDAEDTRREKSRFARRVMEFDEMLSHRIAGALARQTLMNELKIARMEVMLMRIPITTEAGQREYDQRLRVLQDMQKEYRDQMAQLDGVFPWMSTGQARAQLLGMMSDVIAGYHAYYGKADRKLIDGMNAAPELQVELRLSQQLPEPRYRAGLVTYVNAARAGLWDPNWRSQLSVGDLKKLDAAWKAAVQQVVAESLEVVPDLMSDDPEKGEYAPLEAESR